MDDEMQPVPTAEEQQTEQPAADAAAESSSVGVDPQPEAVQSDAAPVTAEPVVEGGVPSVEESATVASDGVEKGTENGESSAAETEKPTLVKPEPIETTLPTSASETTLPAPVTETPQPTPPPQDPRLARLANSNPAPTPVVKTEPSEQSAPTPPPESKTAPLQSKAHKEEALAEVNNFLASVQNEAKATSASTGAAQPDLSTPAARRAHLLQRLEAEPRDAEAWLTLLADSESRLAEASPDWGIDEVRQTYEKFFEVYPNAARQWQAYIDLELGLSNFAQVEQLFTRCLRSTPSVSLWRSYLSYTRRVNPLPAPSTTGDEEGERGRVRKLIEEAFEFATRHVGMSRDSSEIWSDYLRFVKDREAKTPWLSGQKMDDMRRIYQRVVGIPVANVEQIWREYDQFENGLNRVTAKKFLAERSAAYMTARSILREMRGLVDPLHRPLLPRVPAWVAADQPLPADVTRDRERLQGWKAYLEWEESDPLDLTETDREALKKRVDVAYGKATMHMRFYPEIWFMASKWAERMAQPDESLTWLKEGRQACPGSFLLSFAHLEALEGRSQTAEAAGIFESLLSHVNAKIDTLNAATQEQLAKIDATGAEARAQALAARRAGGEADEMEGEEREEERKREEAREAEKEAVQAESKPKVDALKEEASLVWIKWMHFVRRTEGLRPTRAIFSKARKSPHCTWQVYVASALMEYHCSKDAGVATKVFELALKTFGSDEAFVVRYLDFLISINDENNARALFERTITTFTPPERARPVWDRWAEHEYSFGDSASIRKLEARLSETFPEEPPLKRLVDRASYMDIEVVRPRDLGLPSANSAAGQGATAADRAVAKSQQQQGDGVVPAPAPSTASRDAAIAANAAAVAAAIKRPADDPSRGSPGMPDFAKRQRSDAGSAGPPTGPAAAQGGGVGGGAPGAGPAIPTGPSNPNRRGPLAPQVASFNAAGNVGAAANMAPERPLPEAILFFLSILPSTRSFDGPRLPADEILGVVKQANIPFGGPSGPGGNPGMGGGGGGPPGGPMAMGAGRRGGRGGGMGMGRGGGGRRF